MALFGGGGRAAAQIPLTCLLGTPNYDPVLCAQQGGNSVFMPGLPIQVLVAAANQASCGTAIPVTVTVRTVNGAPVADGTPVVITASMGSITPNQAVTIGGI